MMENITPITNNRFWIPTTTEESTMLTRVVLPTTREVKRFSLFGSSIAPIIDSKDYFTEREIEEIYLSLADLNMRQFKRFDNTEELFADLDSE